MKPIRRNPLAVSVLLLLAAAVTGCGLEELYSTWCDRRVTVDGIDGGTEWDGALHLLAKQEITVGLLNDEKRLYLRLSTRSQAVQRQIMTAGLTVWFDERGGSQRLLGIHYPLPSQNRRPDFERRPESRKEGAKRTDRPEGIEPLREMRPGEIEITYAEKNEHSTISADPPSAHGVQCRIGEAGGLLVYELRVPLIRDGDSPYGIASQRPKAIGIGLETGQEEQPRGEMGGGGRGPGGGGRGPTGGGMGAPPQGPPGGMGKPESAKPLAKWLKVHLAEGP